jgi:uncharacterized membrane protein YcaP (DUF421 family)
METLFGSPGHVNAWQECARAVLVFAYGLVLVRLAGRRVFSKWAAVDIIVSIIVGSNLSRTLTGSAPLWGTLAATTALMLLHWLLTHAAVRLPWLSRLVEGEAVPLGHGAGTIDAERLQRHNISAADVAEALRAAGLTELSQARGLVLEPSGKISVLKR